MLYNINHVSLINVTDDIVSVMILYASHVSLISMTDDTLYASRVSLKRDW